jgi:predicted aspartyl protease
MLSRHVCLFRTSLSIAACLLSAGMLMSSVRAESAPASKPAPSELAVFLKAKGYFEVPLIFTRDGHLDVEVKVNGETLLFILDTGAGSTVLDTAVVQRLKLSVQKTEHTLAGIGGAHLLEKTVVERLVVGTLQNREEAIVSDLTAVNTERKKMGMRACDGLLGAPLLRLHCAVIDYPSAKLFLMDPVAAASAVFAIPGGQDVQTTVTRTIREARITGDVTVKLLKEQPATLTKAGFEQLQNGMTYPQVAEALGGEFAKGRMAATYTGTFAAVQGTRRIDLTFQDGKVTARSSKELD